MAEYKNNTNYKAILNMGYIDITSLTHSKKGTIVFQHESEIGRDPKKDDTRYIIQQSGYVRKGVYGIKRVSRNGKYITKSIYDMNGRIIDKFQPYSHEYPYDGLLLLKTNLEVRTGIIKQADTYKVRAGIKVHRIISIIFNPPKYNSFIHYIETGKAYNMLDDTEKYNKILNQLSDTKKKYQAIVRIAKELGI